MSFELSSRTTQALGKIQKTPSLAVIFDGIDDVYSGFPIKGYYLLDDDHLLDDGWSLDSYVDISNQVSRISYTSGSGTTTKLSLKVDPDLGIGDSVSSFKIAIIDDKNNNFLSLFATHEFLAKKVIVKATPSAQHTIYPADFVTVFRGIIDEIQIEAGVIYLNISHPDQKKRQTIFIEHTSPTTVSMNNSVTTIDVEDASDFLEAITGPDGNEDASFKSYVRIDDEIIEYTGLAGNQLTGCVRASLGTIADSHDADTEVKSFYRLTGNAMDLALKLMLSGWNGPFVENVDAIRVEASGNKIIFSGDLFDKYGLTAGDYITTTGAVNGANNVTLKVISSVTVDAEADETTLVIADVTFVNETVALDCDFRSRYDTLPSGCKMSPDEVDVLEHEFLRDNFLFNADMDIYLKQTIDNAKEFIATEFYKPIAAFSLPRQTRASVGYTIPPLPDIDLVTLNQSNVLEPNKIKKVRQVGRNYYNTVLYKFNEDMLEDEFNSGALYVSAESRARIDINSKAFIVEAKGIRSSTILQSAASRRLLRYRYAASQLQMLKTTLGVGFGIDIGDNILVDGDQLKIWDEENGQPSIGTRLFQVIQKEMDLRSGVVQLTVLDTNYSLGNRYGYISPSSPLSQVIDDKTFSVDSGFNWVDFIGANIKVRALDLSYEEQGQIKNVEFGELITLETDLASTPSVGFMLEFDDYDNQTLEKVKTLYTHITDDENDFGDGGKPYYMI